MLRQSECERAEIPLMSPTASWGMWTLKNRGSRSSESGTRTARCLECRPLENQNPRTTKQPTQRSKVARFMHVSQPWRLPGQINVIGEQIGSTEITSIGVAGDRGLGQLETLNVAESAERRRSHFSCDVKRGFAVRQSCRDHHSQR